MNKKQKVPKEKTQAAAKENKVPSVLLVLGCAGLVVVVLCLIVSVAKEGKKPQAKGGKLIETRPNKVVTFEDMEKEESEEVNRLAEEYPDSPNTMYLMGSYYDSLGNTSEATKWWEMCVSKNPQFALPYLLMGDIALKKQNYKRAETMFRNALKTGSSAKGVHNKLGRTLLELGKVEEAVLEFEKDVQLSAESSRSFSQLAQAYMLVKQYEKAEQNYRKAIELKPDFKSAYYGLANACRRLKKMDLFKEYIARFNELEGESKEEEREFRRNDDNLHAMRKEVSLTYTNIGEVYRLEGNVIEAERILRKASVLNPKNVLCCAKLAQVYRAAERYEDLLRVYRQLTELEPKKAIHYFNLGNTCCMLREYGDAQQAYERVIEIEPERPDGYRALAQVCIFLDRNPKKALLFAEKAVRLSPTGRNYYHLALANEMNRNITGALLALRRAIRLEPANRQYSKRLQMLENGE